VKKAKERGEFIDTIQEWFRQRSVFWSLVAFASFGGLIAFQFFLILQGYSKPFVREGIDAILIPMLGLFVLSVFWRGSIPTFLSLAGSACMYSGMFYVYAKAANLQATPFIMHKYPAAIILEDISVSSLANFYFIVGLLALTLSLVIAFRPSFFHARGPRYKQPYQIWSGLDPETCTNSQQMIRVSGLLSVVERELVKKYKYILVVISGRTYFVSPDDWVPEDSSIIRDRESGSFVGILKIDGYNL
jgi:uncharacterized membrane protein